MTAPSKEVREVAAEIYWLGVSDAALIIEQYRDEAVAAERARVVAWLRNRAYSFRTPNAGLAMDPAYRAWRDAANAIERREHIAEGDG